jgi:hypothetical protein
MAAIDQILVPATSTPIRKQEEYYHLQQDVVYIEMNLPADPVVALLMYEFAQPLFAEMKWHLSRSVRTYQSQPSHSIFTFLKISPTKFFAQVLQARINQTQQNLIDEIWAKYEQNVHSCKKTQKKISEYRSIVSLIQDALNSRFVEKVYSLRGLAFQYYVAKTFEHKKMASDLLAAIKSRPNDSLVKLELAQIKRGTYQLDHGKICEIRKSMSTIVNFTEGFIEALDDKARLKDLELIAPLNSGLELEVYHKHPGLHKLYRHQIFSVRYNCDFTKAKKDSKHLPFGKFSDAFVMNVKTIFKQEFANSRCLDLVVRRIWKKKFENVEDAKIALQVALEVMDVIEGANASSRRLFFVIKQELYSISQIPDRLSDDESDSDKDEACFHEPSVALHTRRSSPALLQASSSKGLPEEVSPEMTTKSDPRVCLEDDLIKEIANLSISSKAAQ